MIAVSCDISKQLAKASVHKAFLDLVSLVNGYLEARRTCSKDDPASVAAAAEALNRIEVTPLPKGALLAFHTVLQSVSTEVVKNQSVETLNPNPKPAQSDGKMKKKKDICLSLSKPRNAFVQDPEIKVGTILYGFFRQDYVTVHRFVTVVKDTNSKWTTQKVQKVQNILGPRHASKPITICKETLKGSDLYSYSVYDGTPIAGCPALRMVNGGYAVY